VYGRDISGYVTHTLGTAKLEVTNGISDNGRGFVSFYDGGRGKVTGGGWLRDRDVVPPGGEILSQKGEALLHKSATGHVRMENASIIGDYDRAVGPIEHGDGTEAFYGNTWYMRNNAGASWDWPQNSGVDPHHKFFGPERGDQLVFDVVHRIEFTDEDELEAVKAAWDDKFEINWLSDFNQEPEPPVDPSDPVDPSEPTDPSEPEEPIEEKILKELRGQNILLAAILMSLKKAAEAFVSTIDTAIVNRDMVNFDE
jgi:hypothetical protein